MNGFGITVCYHETMVPGRECQSEVLFFQGEGKCYLITFICEIKTGSRAVFWRLKKKIAVASCALQVANTNMYLTYFTWAWKKMWVSYSRQREQAAEI